MNLIYQRATLEIKGDCKTIVEWINGHAKMKTRESTVENTQNLLENWWGRGVHLRHRTAVWATHIFRERNEEADAWAEKGAKGRVEEWVDTVHVVWSEVIGFCGFWDGSCDNVNCGSRHDDHGLLGTTVLVPYLEEMRASFGS